MRLPGAKPDQQRKTGFCQSGWGSDRQLPARPELSRDPIVSYAQVRDV
jgi:hypothetical protein